MNVRAPHVVVSAHLLPLSLRAAPALRRPGADKVALHIGKAAQHREHQAPGVGAGVGPRLGQ